MSHPSSMVRWVGVPVLILATAAVAGDYVVPLLKQAPAIDGNVGADEWAGATQFDGFVKLGGDLLMERRRVCGWVGADETTIYVAVRSQLPDEGPLLAAVTGDSLKVVHDDSLEVYINPTPDAPDRVDYQFLTNSLGKGGYNIHKTGTPKEAEAWRGEWKQAHGQHDGTWDFECAIPVASMGLVEKGRKTTDGAWAVNLTRNWRPDWAWTSVSGGYANAGLRFRFTRDAAPVVACSSEGDRTFPPAALNLAVSNPSAAPLDVKALLLLVRNNMPELKEEQTLALAAGESKALKLGLDANDPTTRFELTARVTSADGATVYYERQTKWARAKEPCRWVTNKTTEALPIDFKFSYYPSKNAVRIAVDINGLPKDAKLAKVTAAVREHWTRKDVKVIDVPVAEFKDGRQEVRAELPPLDGDYEIVVAGDGEKVPKGETVKTFERQVFPWENLPTGRSTKVYPPFEPIKVDGKTLSTVLRKHELSDVGLWGQVTATSANTGVAKPILAAPMRYTVRVAGADVPVKAEPLKTTSAKEHEVIMEGGFAAGPLKVTFKDTWDYDGTVRVDLTLQPTGDVAVEALDLEIPFSAESAPLIHANSDRIRAPIAQAVPAGDGVVWDASKLACDEYIHNFCPYIFLGSPVRGICWFAENDKGWGWDPKTPNVEVVRQAGQVILRVHLINQPTKIVEPRSLSFGLLAAPVKPMLNAPGQGPNWWRHRFVRDKYSILGTDINWFGNHSCGTVYPVGCNLYLWEMLARGNREKLDKDAIEAVVRYGRHYFEAEGEGAVKTWDAHVRHNLQSRYSTKMIFYYNRAACQEPPEFETFKDEWCLDDLRAIGKGNGRGEIKIVPTPSYIDFGLYWYARSFEVGGNQGVYWDNYFICPSFNTEMTDAYRRDDGSIAPAAGIWGLRELVRRTFVMMNERGMLPVTFPHMTSFSPLPALAFATFQYDWEWKYSGGDVQDRFSREYIQLVTTGELVGAWPVLLGEHGAQSDDLWVQRTFSGVRIVHELDGAGGWASPWVKAQAQHAKALAAPVYEMLDKPGLVVYKHWEDRPVPVASDNPDVPAIVYSVPGKEALAALVSYSREDAPVTVSVDLKALGLEAGCAVTDAETGEKLALADGKLAFTLKKHDIRLLRLAAP
ncbi:MAG: hypothetical protein A3K19_14655 [Lentisphaerae bacterium RIFOXYB12_FULL_65_16]|nr:MAG: hypothetical protein A3K18_28720 [Lentisphaerae bacterium RIFOXYA12_64_32]OGV87463.1 MAG: hypothetical protein A3K19_14655 [Lentisphaerae bacterium RIFOXYB12_FULL_65_16]